MTYLMSADIATIYFVQCGHFGPFKIGLTSRIDGRVSQFRGQYGSHLRLVASVKGSRRDEAALLRGLSASRIFGEWFEPSVQVRSTAEYAAKFGELPVIAPAVHSVTPRTLATTLEKLRANAKLLLLIADAA